MSDVADMFVEVDESASDSLVKQCVWLTTYKGSVENVAGEGARWCKCKGDVWISTDDADGEAKRNNDLRFEKGYSQDFTTLLHEIGQAFWHIRLTVI